MAIAIINFLYGLCVMFFGMTSWAFWHKNREPISRKMSLLMFVLCVQCVKDLFFIWTDVVYEQFFWRVMTCVDMVAVPLYSLILKELCRPGANYKAMLYSELLFILLPILFVLTQSPIFYYIDVSLGGVYGFGYAFWAIFAIPKYHRILKLRFSYDENINLNWLKFTLISFFAIYALWMVSCTITDINIEILYLVGTLALWMSICYFINRHESVIDELNDLAESDDTVVTGEVADTLGDVSANLNESIKQLFEEKKVFLNPHLKLSDVVGMVNSNRTYVSRFFNSHQGKTFFEYVNEYRVAYAKELLINTTDKLDVVAEQSGFGTRQALHRVFIKFVGCTPEQYRSAMRS